jgi:hypothetical protein
MGSQTAVDPVFALVAKALYGDSVDDRELWDVVKGMPDGSATHVPSSGKKKKLLAAGLVAGTAAEALATGHTIKPAIRAIRGIEAPVKYVASHAAAPGKLARSAKVGELALQGGNMAVGLGAAATLAPRKKKLTPIAKADVPHMRPKALVASGARLKKLTAVTKGAMPKAAVATASPGPASAVGAAAGSQAGTGKKTSGTLTPVPGPTATTPVPPPKPAATVSKVDLEFVGTISKVDSEKRQVFGWASLSTVDGAPVVDLQGDYVSIEEIEKSAYAYVLDSRVGGDMHSRISKFDAGPVHTADMIESMVFTPEKLEKMGLAPDALPLGWWVGYHVNDDKQWQDVKDGKRLGFSIHGSGVRKDAHV